MTILKHILSYVASSLLALMIAGMAYVIYWSVEIYTLIGSYGFAIGLTLIGMWVYRQLMYFVFVQLLHRDESELHRLQHVAYVLMLSLILLIWIGIYAGVIFISIW